MRRFIAFLSLAGASAVAAADPGFYAGGGVGYNDEDVDVLGTEVEIEQTDYRILLGYRFNDYLSLQGDLILSDLQLRAFGTTLEEATPLLGELSVKPSLPLGTDRAQLYMRAGYIFDIRDDIDDFDLDVSEWSWAGGLEVFISDRMSVRAEYYGADWESDSFKNGVYGLAFVYNMHGMTGPPPGRY